MSPSDVPWTAEIEYIYESIHPITAEDESRLEAIDYSEEQLREAFIEGWIDKDIDSDSRKEARDAFFEWMEYLGYDRDDFDWNEWRDWAGYND